MFNIIVWAVFLMLNFILFLGIEILSDYSVITINKSISANIDLFCLNIPIISYNLTIIVSHIVLEKLSVSKFSLRHIYIFTYLHTFMLSNTEHFYIFSFAFIFLFS